MSNKQINVKNMKKDQLKEKFTQKLEFWHHLGAYGKMGKVL